MRSPWPTLYFPFILTSELRHLQLPHGKTAFSPPLATRRSALSANQTRGSSTAFYRAIYHLPMTCASLPVRDPNSHQGSYHLRLVSFYYYRRTPIMHLASQALRPTRPPSTRAIRLSARIAPPLSTRRYGRKTTWRARTRSDRG